MPFLLILFVIDHSLRRFKYEAHPSRCLMPSRSDLRLPSTERSSPQDTSKDPRQCYSLLEKPIASSSQLRATSHTSSWHAGPEKSERVAEGFDFGFTFDFAAHRPADASHDPSHPVGAAPSGLQSSEPDCALNCAKNEDEQGRSHSRTLQHTDRQTGMYQKPV